MTGKRLKAAEVRSVGSYSLKSALGRIDIVDARGIVRGHIRGTEEGIRVAGANIWVELTTLKGDSSTTVCLTGDQ